jgi:hypothetical protein
VCTFADLQERDSQRSVLGDLLQVIAQLGLLRWAARVADWDESEESLVREAEKTPAGAEMVQPLSFDEALLVAKRSDRGAGVRGQQ